MKIKLDENLDSRLVLLLKQAGYEAETIRDQGLLGISDEALYEHCIAEGLILVSIDKDFSNVLRYPPESTAGIVVLPGADNLFSTMRVLVGTLIEALTRDRPRGKLWVVEPKRLRIHQPSEPRNEES